MNNNERLLQVYMAGFKDCPDGVNNRNNFLIGREQTAYSLGWWDYVAGDDNPKLDLQSKEEILERIEANYEQER